MKRLLIIIVCLGFFNKNEIVCSMYGAMPRGNVYTSPVRSPGSETRGFARQSTQRVGKVGTTKTSVMPKKQPFQPMKPFMLQEKEQKNLNLFFRELQDQKRTQGARGNALAVGQLEDAFNRLIKEGTDINALFNTIVTEGYYGVNEKVDVGVIDAVLSKGSIADHSIILVSLNGNLTNSAQKLRLLDPYMRYLAGRSNIAGDLFAELGAALGPVINKISIQKTISGADKELVNKVSSAPAVALGAVRTLNPSTIPNLIDQGIIKVNSHLVNSILEHGNRQQISSLMKYCPLRASRSLLSPSRMQGK